MLRIWLLHFHHCVFCRRKLCLGALILGALVSPFQMEFIFHAFLFGGTLSCVATSRRLPRHQPLEQRQPTSAARQNFFNCISFCVVVFGTHLFQLLWNSRHLNRSELVHASHAMLRYGNSSIGVRRSIPCLARRKRCESSKSKPDAEWISKRMDFHMESP